MNIFVLDEDIDKCVMYHNDKHTVKMILEYAQLLCSAHHVSGTKLEIPYKLAHKNHPCTIWVRECIENYNWLCKLALALSKEYTYRYGRRHKSQDVIEWCISNKPNIIKNTVMTSFAQAMPIEYKSLNAIDAYRKYYNQDKQHLANWKYRETPEWFNAN
jgi:hypothetical protein